MKTSDEESSWELRIFLEEMCCNLCAFQHVRRDGLAPEEVMIDREIYLGEPGAFADIRVTLPNRPACFVEIKYGYPPERIRAHLARKFSPAIPAVQGADRLVVVLDREGEKEWPALEPEVRKEIHPDLRLEIWTEESLLKQVREHFDLEISSLAEEDIHDIREAVERAKGVYAFGDAYVADDLQRALLWHFGFWKIRHLREAHGLEAKTILPPAVYPSAAVILADLSSFSTFVRDTPDDATVRQCLTSFYSRARYQILNSGGMMYDFVGDEVIGLFGVPDRHGAYLEDALRCARALVDIGNSVSHNWQRQIDRIQQSGGVHIGMAVGKLQMVALRPFDPAHVSAISDSINMGSRLQAKAGPSEIVISNTFYQGLAEASKAGFEPLDSVDAKNLGRIRAWKLCLAAGMHTSQVSSRTAGDGGRGAGS